MFEAALSRGVLLAPVHTLEELLEFDHLRERGVFDEVVIGDSRRVRVPRPLTATIRATTTPEASHYRQPDRAATGPARPLDGLKVLDLSASFAGPLIGRALADFGAEVIKIESTTHPDPTRTMGVVATADAILTNANRINGAKASVTLNLRTPAGRATLVDLADWADVLIESFPAGVMARLGIEAADLQRANPNLVILSSNLFGQDGPLAAAPGYGNMASALYGFHALTGWPDRAPVGPTTAYTDVASPRLALAVLLAVLDQRRRDPAHPGCHIDFSQGEACLQLLTPALIDVQLNGRRWESMGNDDHDHAPHGIYPTSGDDEWVAIAVTSDGQWRALTALLARPDLAELDGPARLARRRHLEAELSAWTATQPAAAVVAQLQPCGIAAAEVLRTDSFLDDPALTARRHCWTAEHPTASAVKIAGNPILL